MLAFFRKYQRYLYILVTVVIVISFSFFGTYSTLGADSIREAIAFTAVDGTKVPRSELEEMTVFIGTDGNDKQLYGGAWGPNFLNDGVIKKDFLATGLAEILMSAYAPDFKEDWAIRLRKEKNYVPYAHPNAKFVSAVAAWSYFAPEMVRDLMNVQKATDPTDPELLNAKVRLFMIQEQFNPRMLYQVLRYQQGQAQGVPPDPGMANADLFLFGYHNLDDWFGTRFTRLIAQFIINASKIAEQKGYVVTKDEALADLLQRSEKSFRENQNNPQIGVKNSSDYFLEQLRRMGMDQVHAVRIWQEVLLFRRLFHDMGNSVFVDPFAYKQFNQFALEMVNGTLYQLPPELRLGTYKDLQKFEIYLNSVSKRSPDEKTLLDLPQTYLTPEEVLKRHPELVQQRYNLQVAMVDRKALEARVGVKETWDWETADANWAQLKTQYPELGVKKGDTKEERLAALDTLSPINRSKADQAARSAIVDKHPEWVKEALDQATPQTMNIGLRTKGGRFPLSGIADREAFIRLLDKAPLNQLDEKLAAYNAGNAAFYRITVVERAPAKEVLTFAEASRDGTLDEMLEEQVGIDQLLTPLLNAIKADYLSDNAKANPDQLTNDRLASLRFYRTMRQNQAALKKDPAQADKLVRKTPTADLKEQWKLVQTTEDLTRGEDDGSLNMNELLKMQPGTWSSVHTPLNGDMNFFYAVKKGSEGDAEVMHEQISRARWLLSNDAQRRLMLALLQTIQAKKAISFDYLAPKEPVIEKEEQQG
jgi:GcvH upstream region-like protein